MPKRGSLPSVNIAYVEDADSDGHVPPGTEPKYARSTAPGSPRKQQPNTNSTAHPGKGKSKMMRPKDERRSGPVIVSKRPPMRSTKTAPVHSSRASEDLSAYYAIPHQTVPARPRAATRPGSYYGPNTSRPPMPQPPPPMPAFYQPPPPNVMAPPPFPPQSWAPPFPGPMPPPMPPPSAPMDQQYPPRDLAMRFRRPSSSIGFRQASNPYEYEASPERSVARRPSMSRKASKDVREHDDRKRMPPPPQPKATRPNRGERPERRERAERVERVEHVERPERIILKPQPSARKSVVFDDDDLTQDDESVYHSDHTQNILRRGSGVEYGSHPFKNRRQSFDVSESVFNYDDDEDSDEDSEDSDASEYYSEEEPAPRSRSRRRSTVGIEDKIRDASRYQDHLGTGPSSALTADALRRVKTRASSRSTRSSASRDDSEYKHSATTHTTRSSSEDDITIKVSAGCVVEVGNVKIRSGDGGQISVGRTVASHKGSDRGTVYGDERRSRSDRSSRARASSQAAFARGLPAPGSSYSHAPSPLYSQHRYDDDDSSYS